jgi:hypothetical protein
MEGAYKNDIKQLTNLSKFAFIFTIGIRPRGITIPSPYLCTVLSALCTHIQQKFKKSSKICGYSNSHCILMLPSSVLKTIPGPLDLYKPYGLISGVV